MMKTSLQTLLASLLLALCFGMGQTAMAQKGHTLVIKEGTVFIDGNAVPAAALPPRINLDGVEASLNYSGDAKPLLDIGGILYTVEDNQFVAVAPEQLGEGRVSVFFRGDAVAPRPEEGLLRFSASPGQIFARTEPVLSDSDGSISPQAYSQQASYLAKMARQNAEESGEARDMLARVTVQSYLKDVQSQNTALYERLVRESHMEAEAQELAVNIRQTPEGAERDALIASLREKLDAIFEVKQQNRRREIEQLEQQLTELQSRLEKRETYRQRIIEQRLRELTGMPNPRDW